MFNDVFKGDMILKPFPISLLENGIIINLIIGKQKTGYTIDEVIHIEYYRILY